MKIGVVRFYNSRPLDYGLRRLAGAGAADLNASGQGISNAATNLTETIELVEDTPARLFELLHGGALDAALISSVEILRNPDKFAWCKTAGVCAANEVRSIVYIRNKNFNQNTGEDNFHLYPPSKVYTDNGSRTSVALLDILLHEATGRRIEFRAAAPADIPALADGDAGGLLIGDSAIKFLEQEEQENYYVKDLAAWWRDIEELPFVFALWGFPKERPLPDSIFDDSLAEGLANIDQIIEKADFPDARRYLTEMLHFQLSETDIAALERFRERLTALDLL